MAKFKRALAAVIMAAIVSAMAIFPAGAEVFTPAEEQFYTDDGGNIRSTVDGQKGTEGSEAPILIDDSGTEFLEGGDLFIVTTTGTIDGVKVTGNTDYFVDGKHVAHKDDGKTDGQGWLDTEKKEIHCRAGKRASEITQRNTADYQ
ncbi:hypothetical protein FACS189499_08820 [Clostridia bacterium]|nr:hypothetical protein FACS189499_08820 [Clostridia bacterium]